MGSGVSSVNTHPETTIDTWLVVSTKMKNAWPVYSRLYTGQALSFSML